MLRMFADLSAFQRDPLNFLCGRGNSAEAPLVRLALGPKPVWLVTHPDVVKPILRASETEIDKGRLIHKLRLVMGTSSLTLSGDAHRLRRQALHRSFAAGATRQLVPQMSAIIRKTAAQLASGEPFHAHAVTAPLTLRLICAAMFGKDVLSPGDEQAIITAVDLVEDDLADELFRVLPRTPWAAIAVRRRRRQARAILGSVVRRVRDRADQTSAVAALLDLGLSEEELRDELITMLLAGHHTTGSAAAWILYYLATVPGLADRIANEAHALTADSGEIPPSDLARASTSLSLVREVLRLFPSAHWFSRDAKTSVEIAGVRLRPGDAILIAPWQLHRDPRFWDRPNEFDLSRNFGGRAYLPFGAGPRACLGMGLAMLELQLIAIEFAATFKLHMQPPVPAPIPTASVTLIPPEMRIVARLRESQAAAVAA